MRRRLGTRPLRATATVLVAGLAAALLAGCGERAELGEPILAVGGEARPAPVPEQKVGACYAVKSIDVGTPETLYDKPVECDDESATAITYYVGELKTADIVGEAKSFALPQCRDQLPEATGLSADDTEMSAVSPIPVVPDRADYAEGVRTFRCDATLYGTAELRLPGPSLPLFPDGSLPDEARSCVSVAGSGADTTYARVTCDSENSVYRAVGSDEFPEPFVAEDPRSNYPDDDARNDFGQERCGKYADDGQVADYLAPSEAQWGWGDRLLVCFVADEADL